MFACCMLRIVWRKDSVPYVHVTWEVVWPLDVWLVKTGKVQVFGSMFHCLFVFDGKALLWHRNVRWSLSAQVIMLKWKKIAGQRWKFLALSQDCWIVYSKLISIFFIATWSFFWVKFCFASFGEWWQNDCSNRYHDSCMENLPTSTQMTSEWICPFCSLLQSENLLENQIHVKVTITSIIPITAMIAFIICNSCKCYRCLKGTVLHLLHLMNSFLLQRVSTRGNFSLKLNILLWLSFLIPVAWNSLLQDRGN